MIIRRERTRELIALGALVQKSGLVERTGGDRDVLYRLLVQLAEQMETKADAVRNR